MNKITFYIKSDNYVGFKSEGHAGYDERGKDIVCSAISSITQSCALGVIEVLKLNPKYEVNEEKGYLQLRLPDNVDNDLLEKAQVLFKTTYLALKDLSKGYPSNIKVEVKRL